MGRVTLATQRDHIKPLAEGGADDGDNEQGLCEPCHEAKSKAESMRGRGYGKSRAFIPETDWLVIFFRAGVLGRGGRIFPEVLFLENAPASAQMSKPTKQRGWSNSKIRG